MDKLVVVEQGPRFYIQWELDDGDDLGSVLGEVSFEEMMSSHLKAGDWYDWLANKTLHDQGTPRDDWGYWFATKKEALRALKLVNIAKSQTVGRPVPDWALRALEAGWTPPKDWKP